MLLKHPSNFLGLLKMLLIIFKTELKPKWTKYCILSEIGFENMNANPNNI